MKRLILPLILCILAHATFAQRDPEAKALLDEMSSKYKKVNTFSASFSQKIENQSANLDETIKGKITVKGNKYKLEIVGSQVFNNGKEVWVYTPEIEEVTVSDYNPADEEITPANVYDLYKKNFKYALISKLANGDRVIEMDPESRDKSYHKIRLIIDGQTSLKSFTVLEKSGNRYTYTISNFKPLDNLPDSFFTFNPNNFPKVEVVDFRD